LGCKIINGFLMKPSLTVSIRLVIVINITHTPYCSLSKNLIKNKNPIKPKTISDILVLITVAPDFTQ